MGLILSGAIAMACCTISTFFVRFWKRTGDRFFLYFAASFFIEAIERVVMGLIHYSDEQEPLFYLMRLVSFLIIIYAILDKNGLVNRKSSLD